MKKTLFATLLGMSLMAGSTAAAVRFGVGVNIGVHAPVFAAPAPVVVRPPMPGPGYVWIDGYNGPNGFVAGYWSGTRVVDNHTNFRAEPFRDRDDRFRAPDRDDHFRGSDRDDHGRDFRR